ncbi:charged multivesicular body protein 2b-like [Rhinoderma darwinii]|uniref:charged multivesicular body protein 2b-like n=1 Tax=Rhinoderma darwinii TaxID=43563 RepID=UPI003F67E1C3
MELRKQKTRTYAVSSKVTSMSTQTKVMSSQMKMAGAMSTTAKTMQAVNRKMDPQKTLQTMQNFQEENMKMEMTEEMTAEDVTESSRYDIMEDGYISSRRLDTDLRVFSWSWIWSWIVFIVRFFKRLFKK